MRCIHFNESISTVGRSIIHAALSESFEELDEVIVIGYGYQKKSDLTGSISSMKSGDLLKVPVDRGRHSIRLLFA